jgi:HK97 gp10 family phage protein
MAARVTIVGWDRLVRRLDELDDDIREGALKAVQDGADAVRDEARDMVRVDTGRMRQGLKARVDESRLRADVGWSDPDLYYAQFQEFGTSEITANPALTVAGEAERRRFPDRVSEDVRREIER